MASGSLTRQRSVSTKLELPQMVLPKGKDNATDQPFEPCAATASHFLLAHDSTVLVLAHDTLALERRFTSHQDKIELISCDNVSERGQGRLVVTYDVGKTAIIWDLFTGEQISRFSSYEPLMVAAWMRNGNITFGNDKGDVILFEPASSEHISARTIFDPITALAPSSDCKTYAIGYRNGSILLAALQPQFTILHTLNTSRSPSPIAMLTWHASSSKQKSDMLAIANSDGDLRVWSVPKPVAAGQPRVIRVLRRNEGERFLQGRNWVCWSKNGRIVQFSEGETWAWDVRTKDVNYVPVPTIEYVKGVAAFGPTASLFTLGPDHTVQQYDVDAGQMIANIRHAPYTIPPTPPEEHIRQFNTVTDEELNSPLRPSRYDPDEAARKSQTSTSQRSNSLSTSSRKSLDRRQTATQQHLNNASYEVASPAKTVQTATTFSMGAYPYSYPPAQSGIPASPASGRAVSGIKKGSRLRQEVVMSPMTPEDAMAVDLFPFVRARLSEVQQQPPQKPYNESGNSPDDLRNQMLSVVFGWDNDIYELIQDELSRHPAESLNALFLAKWLDYDSEMIAELMGSTPADPMLDWVRLALGILDSRPENKKLGQIFVEKMLSKGEVHIAAAALLALGDKSDAIEVYVSNNCYLEAILLTCLLLPQEWQRQSHLVRKWGEHVVENSQQQLAIRCFSCTGAEEQWTSPISNMYGITSPLSAIAVQPPQQSITQAPPPPPVPKIPAQHYQQQPVQKPPQFTQASNAHISRLKGRSGFEAPTPVALIAPPTPFRTAAARGTRITPQTGGLKLITSFGPKPSSFRFPGLKTDDMTPINASNITPIAESAIDRSALSPGGLGSYRLNNIASLNSAMSAGPVPPRTRLQSIGETPQDTTSPVFPPTRNAMIAPRAPPTPADSGSDKEKRTLADKLAAAKKADAERLEKQKEANDEPPLTLLTSARYTPSATPVPLTLNDAEFEPQTALRPSTSNSWSTSFGRLQQDSPHTRMGARGKKPDGLSLYLQTQNPADPIERPGTVESTTTNFTMSPMPNDGYRVKSPSVSGRSMDQYISSLDQAQFFGRAKSSNSVRPAKEEKSDRKRSKHRKPRHSEDVSHSSGKRSPSSPIPMSPDEVRMYTASVESFNSVYNSQNVSVSELAETPKHQRRESGALGDMGKARNRSRSAQPKGLRIDVNDRRGRSKSRKEGSVTRSPSSPLPMLPNTDDDATGDSNNEGALKFVSQNRSRLQRSVSRRPERGTSSRRDASPDRRRGRARSPSRQRDHEAPVSRKNSTAANGRRKKREDSASGRRSAKPEADPLAQLDSMASSLRGSALSNPRLVSRSKQVAQAELEARRASLARRPSAPTIPMPPLAGSHAKSMSESVAPPPLTRNHTDSGLRPFLLNSSRYENGDLRLQNGQTSQPGSASSMHDDLVPNGILTNDAYQLPARTYSAQAIREDSGWAPSEPPSNMPRHPAFDHRVQSRGTSRTRTTSPGARRGKSVERRRISPQEPLDEPAIIIGSDVEEPTYRASDGPTYIPELQHLAMPPPPPPPPPAPPAPPKDLRIQTDLPTATNIQLPKSAFAGYSAEPASSTPEKGHRRVSSRGNDGQFMGKIRGITDRMRSTSKPRDNISRSPNVDEGIMSPYETVTMIPPPLTSIVERR